MTRARIRLRRSKGWRKPEGAVVVARPSRWGNPFPVRACGLERSLRLFEATLLDRWDPLLLDATAEEEAAHQRFVDRIGGPPAAAARRELRGRDLACWCALDAPCHADLLLAAANA